MNKSLLILGTVLSTVMLFTACGAGEKAYALKDVPDTSIVQAGATAGAAEGSQNGRTKEKSAAAGEDRYMNITPEEAKKRIDSGEKIILLDVRTQEEYEEKRIPGSILIPVEVIEKEAPSKLTDKSAVIFVYCRSGNRSIVAAEELTKLGYTGIYNLGGINDWPYGTVSGR